MHTHLHQCTSVFGWTFFKWSSARLLCCVQPSHFSIFCRKYTFSSNSFVNVRNIWKKLWYCGKSGRKIHLHQMKAKSENQLLHSLSYTTRTWAGLLFTQIHKKHHVLPVILIFTSPQSYFSRCYNMSVPRATLALYSKHTVGGDVGCLGAILWKSPRAKKSFKGVVFYLNNFVFSLFLFGLFVQKVQLSSFFVVIPNFGRKAISIPAVCDSAFVLIKVHLRLGRRWLLLCVTVRVNCAVSVARRSCWQLQTGGKPCNNITLELREWVFVRKWVHTCSVRIFTLNDSVRLNSASFSWYLLI